MAKLRGEYASSEQLINKRERELVAVNEAIATLPVSHVQLCKDRDRRATLRVQQEIELRVAQSAMREKLDLLAQQVRQEQLLRNQELQAQEAIALAPASPPAPAYSTSTRTSTNNSTYPTAAVGYSPSLGRYYDYNYRPPVGDHYVSAHVRRDGTFVSGHHQTNADGSFWNNWSSSGNVNPYTSRVGTKQPSYGYGGGSKYVGGHVRSNGTYVPGYYRSR